MNLRIRLLLSYIVVLAVTLVIIVGALLLFLNTRPAPLQQTYRDLTTFAQANTRFLTDLARSNDSATPLQSFLDSLTTFAADNDIRILIINRDNQRVIFDTYDSASVGGTLDWQAAPAGDTPQMPRLPQGGMMRGRLSVEYGTFTDPDDSEWLFALLALDRGNSQGLFSLLFAQPLQAQSLRAVLVQFEPALVRPLIQAALIGLLIAVLMAFLISRTIARPLQQIAEATRSAQPAPVAGPPEVRAVAEAINQMRTEVQTTQTAQQDFIVNVSHDLKTPLTSIQGYSQAIMDGAANDPIQAAAIIHEEADRLNRLVSELTDLARLQNGQMSMHLVPLDVNPIVQAISQRLGMMAQKKNIALRVDTTPVPPITGDGDRLAQVVTNLLSNAIKYTPGGGSIHVRTQINNGGVELTVQDNGIGILADDLPRIFERLSQADKTRGPRRGTGLGLAITQEIVQAHGGKISVTSAGAQQGSTFTVWLPAPQLKSASSSKR